MASTVDAISIEEATERLIDYRGKTPPKTASGVRLITAKVVKGGQILEEPKEFIAEDFYDEWMRRGLPQELDVLLTTEAPLGETAILRDKTRIALAQRIILLRAKREVVDPLFLFYALQSDFAQSELKARASGTTVLGIKQSELRRVRIPLFSLSAQLKIGSILATYDELIENNQRRIRILEQMARRLYREWFVHFRFPGHENHPRVPSPLGEIPQGWEVRNLECLMVHQIGGGWGKDVADDTYTEPAWVIRGTDIPGARSAQVDSVPYRYHTLSNLRSRRLQAGDIVFEVSGGSKGQPVGRTLLITPELLSAFGGDDVMCASFCKRIQPDQTAYGPEMLYLSFLEGYESGEIEQYQVQSTGISNFKWTEYIANTLRVVPPDSLRKDFQEIVRPLLREVATLGLKSANLRRTRDLLLPRLLSGQIKLEAN
ncbi:MULTISPECIES: restriction endonuclease subunit S [Acidobacterium]|uniref:Type I restriction-modification system, S subunit n=1 Tax=Acidobacterium capsulatum (strain ATCC 51196 / DSM 11244 / BCRC 80197 / JCM 7670 / NBRC 15755 / NCIMB 13165 / 161) TaxID=240015 RepID=C1F6N1_ACIC5|nr:MULTISPECIES: restriction endonuclease subunit S [Acidobacterium]ACO31304.1 type I restriction-modification system, S subunit [Acidobacterium capsulatum ATCC 51196]HCT60923.1 restriction endonuclease subunit S [Acidobacterium sp.]